MFKSLFTKYITAFMLIIVVSFTVLAAIISTMVTNYSMQSQKTMVGHISETGTYLLTEDYFYSGDENFEEYMQSYGRTVKKSLTMLSRYTEDVVLFVTDTYGNVLATDEDAPANYIMRSIPAEVMKTINAGNNYEGTGTLDGAFEDDHLIFARPVSDADGNILGALFTCSSSQGLSIFVETMVKTIIMASLWVLLAALIAVYFISEKIIAPIKVMSRAAKSFAAGKFDVRVPVTGHDEVAELAVAFNNMATNLASFEDMRRTFLANVSHDLRTPMTTIAGFIDGILDGAIPPEKHSYYLGLIATEVRRLSRLVSSLLDISRIQAGDRKFNKTVFDISEMARLILISFEQKIDEKKLDVEFDCEEDKMLVYADRDAIYQILYNICDNAVKFSFEGGKYRISLINKDKKTFISVYNEGQGIPEADLPFVFDRFYKSDRSRGLDKTGVGLGLYIAKTIIDAHDEEIWVRSVYGEYCEFVFTLQSAHEGAVKPIKSTEESE
ncbi:MAG: HAMP domain-containing protein [Clostridia bacterium]|nr:HAMP domain-containing protein [Clostridia bacterium]MBQ4575054.1 HAMP domain-containing protein [Clostridia bacterium]